MKTKNLIEGLIILEQYRNYSDGYNVNAIVDEIHVCSTDRPISKKDIERLVLLGWEQNIEGVDTFTEFEYDINEPWIAHV